MKWYWWIGLSILAINGFVIIMIGVALVVDRARKRRDSAKGGEKGSALQK